MTQEEIDIMREKFMGKRISFKTESGDEWFGVCEFLGYNPHLPSWKFQVTVGRTPISHVRPETIKIVN